MAGQDGGAEGYLRVPASLPKSAARGTYQCTAESSGASVVIGPMMTSRQAGRLYLAVTRREVVLCTQVPGHLLGEGKSDGKKEKKEEKKNNSSLYPWMHKGVHGCDWICGLDTWHSVVPAAKNTMAPRTTYRLAVAAQMLCIAAFCSPPASPLRRTHVPCHRCQVPLMYLCRAVC